MDPRAGFAGDNGVDGPTSRLSGGALSRGVSAWFNPYDKEYDEPSAEEQAAAEARERGENYDDKAFKRYRNKQQKNEKYAQTRNKQKRQSNYFEEWVGEVFFPDVRVPGLPSIELPPSQAEQTAIAVTTVIIIGLVVVIVVT